MRNILFIAYQFPPIGGAGVRRSIHFVNQLPKLGFQPIVITIQNKESAKTGKPQDEIGLSQISPETNIHRLKAYINPHWIKTLQRLRLYRLFWFLFYPFFWERGCLWPFLSSKKIAEIGKKNNCKIVYTSSSPYFTILLGWWLKKKYTFKWVADIRDPFTDCYGYAFPSKIHWRISKAIEHYLLKCADHVIVNNDEVKRLYVSHYGFSPQKVSTIHNMISHD
jgi:glycosyltransferase involved in cell wall biosynthesis